MFKKSFEQMVNPSMGSTQLHQILTFGVSLQIRANIFFQMTLVAFSNLIAEMDLR